MEATAEYSWLHPSQQITVQEHYLDLIEYLVEQPDMVLMPYEREFGREDQHDTITAHEVLTSERLEQQEGYVWLTPEVEQCMVPGSGPDTVKPPVDMKNVPHQGIPILHYEWGLFVTVMARADYGESDLMDNQHTLFLKDLSDQQVYTNTIMLEQVTDSVCCKMIKQLPQLAWDMLHMFEFGDREEGIRCCASISNRPMEGMPNSWNDFDRREPTEKCWPSSTTWGLCWYKCSRSEVQLSCWLQLLHWWRAAVLLFAVSKRFRRSPTSSSS